MVVSSSAAEQEIYVHNTSLPMVNDTFIFGHLKETSNL